ncbi:RNA 2',3'-cyclic phosphodiesterase [Mycoplasmatota bacterium]|nr:RNA 2',3'-cyclic phosphodiesterase [Mycoplasmatota bacterium]
MRLFIAINFEKEVKDYLCEVQSIIKTSSLIGRYTLYDNFHLTLRFLGELNQSDVELLCELLDDLSQTTLPFKIKIGDIHSFNRKDKHIVYVDVLKNKNKLIDLVNKLNCLIDAKFLFKKNNQFKPHITIAREVVFNDVSSLLKIIPYNNDILVNEVSLMLSTRDKNHILTYTPLYTVNLKD